MVNCKLPGECAVHESLARDTCHARMQHAVADDQPIDDLDAGDDMTELCVATFEMCSTGVHDEELASGGIGTRIRHTHSSPLERAAQRSNGRFRWQS